MEEQEVVDELARLDRLLSGVRTDIREALVTVGDEHVFIVGFDLTYASGGLGSLSVLSRAFDSEPSVSLESSSRPLDRQQGPTFTTTECHVDCIFGCTGDYWAEDAFGDRESVQHCASQCGTPEMFGYGRGAPSNVCEVYAGPWGCGRYSDERWLWLEEYGCFWDEDKRPPAPKVAFFQVRHDLESAAETIDKVIGALVGLPGAGQENSPIERAIRLLKGAVSDITGVATNLQRVSDRYLP